MLSTVIAFIMSNLLLFRLHVEGHSTFKKPLSAEKERHYFELKAQGDHQARDILIEHNLRLVAHICKKYYNSSTPQEDLISIGTIGLIKAVNTFAFEKGARFATYAARCIDNEILMHFRSAKKTANDVYMNEPIDSDGDGSSITLMDTFADDENLEENLELKVYTEKLYENIDKYLETREKEIIVLRYGLYSHKALTQREIAKKLNISRSYVSRIEKKALDKLKDKF